MRLEAVTDAGAVIEDKEGRQTLVPCDTVVLALGVEPRTEVTMRFEDLAPEVRAVGDCSKERGNLYSATLQGFFAAMDL
jgi:thioredoxin reductase